MKRVAAGMVIAVAVVIATATVGSSQRQAPTPAPPAVSGGNRVSQAQLNTWKTEVSNWGRWGQDDQRARRISSRRKRENRRPCS